MQSDMEFREKPRRTRDLKPQEKVHFKIMAMIRRMFGIVCMYACMYVCMYACVYECMCRIYVYTYIHT